MAANLRQLLIQRAARLQDRPALSAPGWGTLNYSQFRNRVEGIALGLLATPLEPGTTVFAAGSGPWAWAAEVAAACCGLVWAPAGEAIAPAILGGPRFNDEDGRGPYHDRENAVHGALPFHAGLDQETVLRRLARLNTRLGWDHDSVVSVPCQALPEPEVRAALWSVLYAGAHGRIMDGAPERRRWFSNAETAPAFDPEPFLDFWEP